MSNDLMLMVCDTPRNQYNQLIQSYNQIEKLIESRIDDRIINLVTDYLIESEILEYNSELNDLVDNLLDDPDNKPLTKEDALILLKHCFKVTNLNSETLILNDREYYIIAATDCYDTIGWDEICVLAESQIFNKPFVDEELKSEFLNSNPTLADFEHLIQTQVPNEKQALALHVAKTYLGNPRADEFFGSVAAVPYRLIFEE